jgi:hypothetical protein
MFLFRSFYRHNNKPTPPQEPPEAPAISCSHVITVLDEEGFSHVNIRPLTYAEAASKCLDAPPRHIYAPSSWLDDEYDDDDGREYSDHDHVLESSGSNAAIKRPSTLSTAVQSELQYGDLARQLTSPVIANRGRNRTRGVDINRARKSKGTNHVIRGRRVVL